MHDIATPRRTVGGRCRKWCISAQPASGKRKCAACNLCGIRFTQGEARLQQWGNRDTNHHYVHAHCVNGGLGHDHELFPKQATDQDAVDAVMRQRDIITRTAADTENLLPFAQDLEQASTAAPPDDERDLFGREEALRMDEEIMDFQWFEQVTWDSIKDLRGTTYVQPPTRFKFALQQAQHAILRAIIHNNPTSSASESAWKALVLSSWLLLGRPAVNASESNCAHFLDARLELFWAEDWSTLWAMVRAECDVAPVQNSARRTEKQQIQSRIRKVATLARTGEKGRALAAARNAPPVPVTEQIVQEIKSLYPTDPEPPAPASASISALFLSEVAEQVPSTLRKMPRLSEPGPLGMRAEHWYDFGSLAGNSDLFVQVVAHIAAAAVPNSVLQYLRAGQITPLAKPTGGHRPLLMMSFLRRLALKSVMAAKNQWLSVLDHFNTVSEDQMVQIRWSRPSSIWRKPTTPESSLLSTSRLHSRTSTEEPCYAALLKPTQTLQQSSPGGTQAQRNIECTTTLPTPKSLPTLGWIRVVLYQHVVSLQLLTRHFTQS